MGKNKQWKQNGPEDKLLNTLIKDGKINKHTKISTLKAEHPSVFGSFTDQVMRNHLSIAKRSHGLYRK